MRSSACCRRYAALLAIVTNVRKSHIPGKRHSTFVVPGFAAIIFWFHAGCGLGLCCVGTGETSSVSLAADAQVKDAMPLVRSATVTEVWARSPNALRSVRSLSKIAHIYRLIMTGILDNQAS